MKFCFTCHIHSTSYHLFKHFNNFLQGKCFHSQQDAENAFQEFIASWSTDFYATAITKLISHCQKCDDCNGFYFDLQSDVVEQSSWALSVDSYRLQALQFLVHLINLLSILLRCYGFNGTQKAIGDQMGSRPPNSDHDLSFGASLALQSALGLLFSSTTELVITGCYITCHCI